MTPAPCPYPDDDLLPVALGQPASDQLQVHLADCTTCQQRLQHLQAEAAALRQAALDPYATQSRSPVTGTATTIDDGVLRSIGKYLIVGQLGKGAQAAAYRAVHPNLPKELAIKLAHNAIPVGSEERDLLVREGRHLAELDHPNIARVCDLDFHAGRPFLVMEYHRGVNLQQYAKARQPRPREAAALLVPLARAVQAAHRRGLVHQDIKPANILVAENGTPYLLDFGLAQLADAWNDGIEQPSGGTAAYMAPEQARGDAKATPAVDIFALGGVLYFLLTGHPPFPGRDSHEAMQHARRCEFDRMALYRRGIPRRLAAICVRAMAAEPADRYASADEFAADLERYLRPAWALIALAVTAASVVILLLGAWYFWPQPTATPPAMQPLIATISRTVDGKARLLTPDKPERLANLVPLRPGDQVELSCEVPAKFETALFLVDTTGALHELESLQVSNAGPFDRVRFPANGVWQVEGRPGVVLFLTCASRRGKPLLDEVRILAQGDKPAPLPTPTEDFLLLLNRDSLKAFGEEPRDVVETRYSQLHARLEQLRAAAAGRFDYVWGAALPVR